MKVLLTGTTGFLGRSILKALLREGYSVRALVRAKPAAPADGVEYFEGDLTDRALAPAAVAGVDAVVHAAARVTTSGSWEEFAAANVRATRDLIRAARAAGVARFVHISSLSVYAVDRDGVTIVEDSPYDSESSARGGYSRSKLAADRVALWEAGQGAPVVVLRPGLLYGPGKRPPLARQNRLVKGWQLLLARPEYPLPLTHVDNVADAVICALRAPGIEGQAFTIVDDNVAQRRYLDLYRAASGENWRPLFLPVNAVALAAKLAERALGLARRRSPITYHQVRRATDAAFFDCTRAHRVLGWQPRIALEDGLRQCFAASADHP